MAQRQADLYINVTDLRKRLGNSSVILVSTELESVKVIETVASGDVSGEIVLESIERGITARGSVEFNWQAACRRCLEPVEQQQSAEIDAIYQLNAPEDSELIDFDGVHCDLLPVVTEAVAFSLPLAPLCASDCAGPAPEAYPTVLEADLEKSGGSDPRWDALSELKFD